MSAACWMDSPSPRTHWLICLHGKGKLISWLLYQKRPWKDNGKSIAFLTLNFSLKNRSMYQSKVRSQWQFQYFRKGRRPHKIKKNIDRGGGHHQIRHSKSIEPGVLIPLADPRGRQGRTSLSVYLFFKFHPVFTKKIAKIIGCPAPPPLVATTSRLWNPGSATGFHQRNEI